MIIRQSPSPNRASRSPAVQPTILVLHYTGTQTAQDAEDVYLDPDPPREKSAGPVSPHYMIDYNGDITQFVSEDDVAWHAGHSWWEGQEKLNAHSIGIEIVNPGHLRTYRPFTQAQMDALKDLAGGPNGILARHSIPAWRVVGHSDIAPASKRQKPDPGELMDWFWLASHGIGLYPQPTQEDFDLGNQLYNTPQSLRAALTEYGYDPREDAVSFSEIVTAFQRHFQQHVFQTPQAIGHPDAETRARIHNLLRQKNVLINKP